jgi:hypothetical protein
MTDEQPKKRPISEISHLFLSSVRDLHAVPGVPTPRRKPPARQAPEHAEAVPTQGAASELTPEEYARVLDAAATDAIEQVPDERPPVAPVTAVVAAHLESNTSASDRVRQYARHLAARHGRVGLIEVDASDFRLSCFDAAGDGAGGPIPSVGQPEAPGDCYDPRQIAEALEEMNWDVRRWLLLLTNPRTLEAKTLLRQVGHWVLLSTCDHDGVVSSYRMLKGLSDASGDAGASSNPPRRPKLTLALLGAADEAERARVFRKLSGVCEQFLEWTIELEPAVCRSGADATAVVEHLALNCHPTRDKAQIATTPHWPVVADFVARAKGTPADAARRAVHGGHDPEDAPTDVAVRAASPVTAKGPRVVADVVMPVMRQAAPPIPVPAPAPAAPFVRPPAPTPTIQNPAAAGQAEVSPMAPNAPPAFPLPKPAAFAPVPVPPAAPQQFLSGEGEATEILDLPSSDAPASAVLGAFLSRRDGTLVECPLRPPMCPDARLAVSRDRGVVLLAVARPGLADLRAVGRAYQWLLENRALIAMAVPQFALDATRTPRLHLLVDHADASADVLRPMLETEHVTLQAYRRLKWGGKSGLLLEAA